MSIKVFCKLESELASLPVKTFDRDFCYDCIAISKKEIFPNIYEYELGFSLAFDFKDLEHLLEDYIFSFDFRARSSVWKTGLILANCVGTGDELYRGTYKAVFYHINTELPPYEVGDKIVQLKVGFTPKIEFEVVDKLDDTDRGSGGFGSTGK